MIGEYLLLLHSIASPHRSSPSSAISKPIMPTPESPLFLARKPKVPPTFDGVNYDNEDELKAAQDSVLREQWVKSMMARLVRDEMGKCYVREGVNHLEKCGRLRGMFVCYRVCRYSRRELINWLIGWMIDRYLELLKDSKVRGYLFEQQNYIPKAS